MTFVLTQPEIEIHCPVCGDHSERASFYAPGMKAGDILTTPGTNATCSPDVVINLICQGGAHEYCLVIQNHKGLETIRIELLPK